MNRKFLVAAGVLYFIATILGVTNVLNGNFSGIAWGFVPMGIFIWGDAIVLGPFIMLACLWLLSINKPVWTGLFFSVFATVRSFIEIIYALNAQFSSTVRPWELEWKELGLVKSIGLMEIFVVYQLIFTCVFIISILTFSYFLKRYLRP